MKETKTSRISVPTPRAFRVKLPSKIGVLGDYSVLILMVIVFTAIVVASHSI